MEFYTSKKLVCLIPQKLGLGGPASFQARLTSGLTRMGIEVTHDPLDPAVSAILVNGGTKDLALLYQAKRRGVRIVQRLNGMNWIHRKRFTGIRHFVRAEWGNWVLGQIRNHLADAIVYQSQFSQRWWNDARGEIAAAGTVIYNGVDLSAFTPEGPESPFADSYTVLVVEGHLGGGYDQGLVTAVRLVELLNHRMDKMVRLMVAGDVPPRLKDDFKGYEYPIQWLGVVKRRYKFLAFDRSAHVLFQPMSTLHARMQWSRRWLADCRSSALTQAHCLKWSPRRQAASLPMAAMCGIWTDPMYTPWQTAPGRCWKPRRITARVPVQELNRRSAWKR